MWWCALVVLCAITSKAEDETEWKLVRTAQGPVRGRKEPDGVYAFYNIPYATAPTGENKFKAPLPPPNWTEPFIAIDERVICPQVLSDASLLDTKTMQEDCLIANIYVPDTDEQKLSVVVYIHGGAFQMGFGDRFKAKNLMRSKKLIVVNFNYRLGIHGFLCLGTKDVPGNAGMKDQVAMLRWVKENIANFGGNPNDVTISGDSAGAAAADLLILSKSAKGLFNKVIIESGSNLAAFAVQSDPLANARKHAKTFNFTDVDDIYALEKFYKTASYETLTLNGFLGEKDSTFVFSPCVERDVGDEIFLDDSPRNILKRSDYEKLPMLYGITNMDGLVRLPFFLFWAIAMNNKFSDFLPADLVFESDEQKEDVANQIKEFYFGNSPVGLGNILGYVAFFTDITFTSPALRSVELNTRSGNKEIYLYEYSFVDDNTPLVPFTNVRGADHGAQTMAVLDGIVMGNPDESNASPELQNMKKIMREIWHNFITTGNPVPAGSPLPEWPAAGVDRSPYMNLKEQLELGGVLLEERIRFWDDIYQKYYLDPVPPPTLMPNKSPIALLSSTLIIITLLGWNILLNPLI